MNFHTSPLAFLFSPVKLKIVKFLLKNESLMSEREISRSLNVSHMSVNRIMRELAALHFVTLTRAGTAHLWKTNRQSYAYTAFSKALRPVFDILTPIEDLKLLIRQTLPLSTIEKMILFGSLARQKESLSSDIDLFVLVKAEAEKTLVRPALESLSVLCLKKYGHPLSPYLLTFDEAAPKKGLKLFEEIGKGIIIHPAA